MRRLILLLSTAVLVAIALGGTAEAHSNGKGDAVDNEWERIQDSSKYNVWKYCCDAVQAISSHAGWDDLNCRWTFQGATCPGVDLDVIGIDSGATSDPGLRVSDQYVPHATWGGMVRNPTAGRPDYMYINTYYADMKTERQMFSLFNHELGHTLSFDHPPDVPSYWKISVMVPCSACHGYPYVLIPSHDATDYIKVWLWGVTNT